MSNNIVQFNEEIIKGQIKELVRGSVEGKLCKNCMKAFFAKDNEEDFCCSKCEAEYSDENKANANTKKQVKEQIPAVAKHYAKELMEEVNADREVHGKKPFDDDNDDDPPAPAKKRKDNTSKKKLARRKKKIAP